MHAFAPRASCQYQDNASHGKLHDASKTNQILSIPFYLAAVDVTIALVGGDEKARRMMDPYFARPRIRPHAGATSRPLFVFFSLLAHASGRTPAPRRGLVFFKAYLEKADPGSKGFYSNRVWTMLELFGFTSAFAAECTARRHGGLRVVRAVLTHRYTGLSAPLPRRAPSQAWLSWLRTAWWPHAK